MQHRPPFRLARANVSPAARAATLSDPGCCPPAVEPPPAPTAPVCRRIGLAELDPRFYCSLIGTCLTTGELRKLVPRFAPIDRERASDLEIHHEAVTLACTGGAGAKAIQKALDDRHALTVRRFASAQDDATVLALWQAALKSGDVPGAYWAAMTHADATPALREEAFGDVHMLSHLVGAANRADIQRLASLEAEHVMLGDKADQLQLRLLQQQTDADAAARDAAATIDALRQQLARFESATDALGTLAALRLAQASRDAEIARLTARVAAADARANAARDDVAQLRLGNEHAQAQLAALRAEVTALEGTLTASWSTDNETTALRLNGQRIVYVGGRPGSTRMLKSLVEAAGGDLQIHDGGIEDRKGLLAAMVARADMVMFPVDCIDHDSMNTIKRVCDRHGVAWHAIRTASVASFVELASRLPA